MGGRERKFWKNKIWKKSTPKYERKGKEWEKEKKGVSFNIVSHRKSESRKNKLEKIQHNPSPFRCSY